MAIKDHSFSDSPYSRFDNQEKSCDRRANANFVPSSTCVRRRRAVSRHRQIMNLVDAKPIVGENVFLAPSASVIGNVELGSSSSIWYGAVLRGDVNSISIGTRSNIQDRCVVNTSKDPWSGSKPSSPTLIGSGVTIGQGAVVQSATIDDEAMIGAGAIVLDGATIMKHAYVSPGAVVESNAVVGEGELWAGSPAVMVRKLTSEEIDVVIAAASDYVTLAAAHAAEAGKTHDQIEAEKLRRELRDERSDDYNSHIGILGKEDIIIETQARIIEENRKGLYPS
jgi:gamma-carbonic anhydrase